MSRLPDHDYAITAASGTSYSQRYVNRDLRWAPVKSTFHDTIVVIDAGGTSEISALATPEDAIEAVASYWDNMRTQYDIDLLLCSTIPTFVGETSGIEAVREGYNEAILSDPSLINADGVVDWAGIDEAQDPSDTDWFSDGYHPTPALAEIWADLTYRKYRSL